jgi:hypothetical protein
VSFRISGGNPNNADWRFRAKVYKRDSGGTETLVVTATDDARLAVSWSNHDFSATPGAGVSFSSGDRIVVKVYLAPDTGGSVVGDWLGVSFDSTIPWYVDFTENFTIAGPPSYRAGSASLTGVASGTTVTPSLPVGWQADDIALALVTVDDVDSNITASAGWNLIGNQTGSVFAGSLFWRRLQVGDGNPTFTAPLRSGTGENLSASIAVFSGCVTNATPYEDARSNSGTGTPMTGNAAGITTTGANRLAVSFAGRGDDDAISTTPSTSWTHRFALTSTAGNDAGHALETRVVSSATTISTTSRSAAATDPFVVFTLALLPVPSSGDQALTHDNIVDSDTLRVPTAAASYTLTLTKETDGDTPTVPTVAAGAYGLTLTKLVDGDTLTVPTVVPGSVTATAPRIDDADTPRVPTAAAVYALTPAKEVDADTLSVPTVSASKTLTHAKHTDSDFAYPPVASLAPYVLSFTKYDDSDSLKSQTVETASVIAPAHYVEDESFYSPTVVPGATTLTVALYGDGDNLFAPNFEDTQSLLLDSYSDGDTLPTPTVIPGAISVAPASLSDGDTLTVPTVAPGAAVVAPVKLTDSDTVRGPSSTRFISHAKFVDGDTVRAPSVSQILAIIATILSDSDTFGTPYIYKEPGNYANSSGPANSGFANIHNEDLDVFFSSVHDDGDTVRVPAVTLDAGDSLIILKLSDDDTPRVPTVNSVASISPPLHVDSDSTKNPIASASAVFALIKHVDADTIRVPSVTAHKTLSHVKAVDIDTLKIPTVLPGTRIFSIPKLVDVDSVPAVFIAQGSPLLRAPHIISTTVLRAPYVPAPIPPGQNIAPALYRVNSTLRPPGATLGPAPKFLLHTKYVADEQLHAPTLSEFEWRFITATVAPYTMFTVTEAAARVLTVGEADGSQ